jgi:dienelactone hydrolase
VLVRLSSSQIAFRLPLHTEIDHTFPVDARRRAEDILVEKKHTYHFQVFSGVSHGFAIRGNPEVENERELCTFCYF